MTRYFACQCRSRAIVFVVLLLAAGCGGPEGPVQIGSFPLDDTTGLLGAGENVEIDADQSVDGGGSLHIFSEEGGMLVNLYELTPGEFAGDTVVLNVDMKCEMLGGSTFLDLWIFTADGAPRTARKLCKDISRTKDWQEVEIRVPLLPDEVPQKMRIALILKGRGHLWIDDLKLFSAHAQDATGQE